jgi:hypothetical protein
MPIDGATIVGLGVGIAGACVGLGLQSLGAGIERGIERGLKSLRIGEGLKGVGSETIKPR